MIENTGPVPSKDMQTWPLRSGHIYVKDAHYTEPNEKSIFLFLIFKFIYNFVQKWPNLQERCFFCATFSFWDMVDFDVVIMLSTSKLTKPPTKTGGLGERSPLP